MVDQGVGPASLEALFCRTRATTVALCVPLETEDFVVQSMPDASPAKWHLAHTSWFFEQFLLVPHLPGYQRFHDGYGLLFNSYYQGVGRAFTRAQRGLLSRPTVADVMRYRAHVDAAMVTLLNDPRRAAESTMLTELGCHHEQQHQELLLTDIKHALSINPLRPVYRSIRQAKPRPARAVNPGPLRFVPFDGGIVSVGHQGRDFCFDNETPRHQVLLQPFELAQRLVTNAEYRDFVAGGGYRDAANWLSDGWAVVEQESWQRPLYWSDDCRTEFTLLGPREIDPAAPVCHISLYEADAYARAVGARLPTEHEWESVAERETQAGAPGGTVSGNLLEADELRPLPSDATPAGSRGAGVEQLFGDVWEWTQSAYSAYPGFTPWTGSIAEYNGKFMANQFVLRGGSCVTPASHIRATYRNFFPPHARWQFAGLRLARDC
ncbi:MAG: ergothioneine biosynthesis protein EgtB [Steroidobacteraceae bacterium]